MKRITQKIKAIIFDMDGTIIDSEGIWEQAKSKALADFDIQYDLPEHQVFFTSLIGLSPQQTEGITKDFFGLALPEGALTEATGVHANKLFMQEVAFIKGFELFHQRLQELQVPTGLATNCDLNNLSTIVEKVNMTRFFGSHIYAAAHVDYKHKPDPAVFLHTAQQLGVDPSACVVFEDSNFGFQAAKAAGMKCVAIKSSGNGQNLDMVTTAISDYSEAEKALVHVCESW
ncbi:MAG: HAD family phosphatase [Candidatus Babeliales bacterium]